MVVVCSCDVLFLHSRLATSAVVQLHSAASCRQSELQKSRLAARGKSSASSASHSSGVPPQRMAFRGTVAPSASEAMTLAGV